MRCRDLIKYIVVSVLLVVASYACSLIVISPPVQPPTPPPIAFPVPHFHEPTLNGVEQLLVLDERWVIVVVNKLDELVAEIDNASDGLFVQDIEMWLSTRETSSPNWAAYNRRWTTRDEHIAQARLDVGELLLSQTSHYTVTSVDDDNYVAPVAPTLADRLYVSEGDDRKYGGTFTANYNVYAYLELPTPMQDGATYTIALNEDKSVTFLFDRLYTVSRAIKVNQVGYLPDAGQKRAYLGAYLYQFGPLDLSHATTFEVIDATNHEVVFTGDISLLEANPQFEPPTNTDMMYGEDVYVADFTSMTQEGVFFISVPGIGRSWPFRHDASAYAPVFHTMARGLYLQRAGVPIEEERTNWPRRKAVRGPLFYESEHVQFPPHSGNPPGYDRFDVIGASIDYTRSTPEASGGWHDAADWDSNQGHYTIVFDLLHAFALNPSLQDMQLNIPESGDGIPDILNEVRHGLELWRLSQEADGGVSGMLETWTHPDIDAETGNGRVDYAFAQRTRWTSLIFAAAAAQYAQLVAPYDAADAALYRASAEDAYAFGNNPANSLGATIIHAAENRGSGTPYTIEWTELDEYITPYLMHAKLRLYLLTKDTSYLTDAPSVLELESTSHFPFEWKFTHKDWSPWIFFSIIEAAEELPSLAATWTTWFINDADALVAHVDDAPYAMTWPRRQDFFAAWGNTVLTNYNRSLFIAYEMTGDAKYRDAAISNANYVLGANPMGLSWATGIGYAYPVEIQHKPSDIDDIDDPVPGIVLFGITGGPIYSAFRNDVWESPNPLGGTVDFVSHASQRTPPFWRRWMIHPRLNTGQCEFTIHETNSSLIFTAAMLLREQLIIEQNPKEPGALYGRWYLP